MPLLQLVANWYRRINMTIITYTGVLLAALWFTVAQNQTADGSNSTSSELIFGPVNFGGYDNYVYRDNVTAVQLVISE
jgi:hypothetical protein